MMTQTETRWPALPLERWQDTYDTLHMWTQIVGKICLALTPRQNHFWNVAFHVSPRGLATPLLTSGEVSFTLTFDFVNHELVFLDSNGGRSTISLKPASVADFYAEVMDLLAKQGVRVKIWTMPVEYVNPIRFTEDRVHASYDARAVEDFWRIILSAKTVFDQFRCDFLGKCSPVHFFWGSFDLAVTRFSGRRAPERPEMGSIYVESYSHEVISHGFWPGSAPLFEPAFYAYAVPMPAGYPSARVMPEGAYWHQELNEFILPYEAVRRSSDPDGDLAAFLRTTYDTAADLAGWDREALER